MHQLTKTYAGLSAVDGLNFQAAQGELTAFLGPSGCGKTTLLRMIAGLIPPTSGRIVVDGRDLTHVPTHHRDMGLVFQSYALFPHMSIEKNVAFGLEMRKVGKHEIARRVQQAIAMVRLEGKAESRPSQLSGGQQQRVALARALVFNPSILLLDEPLSNLDAQLRDEMRTEIRDIQKRLGITAIFVTHDQVEALTICDKVVVMNGGRLEQFGTPLELYERPATPFVASFVGRTNRFRAIGRQGSVEIAGTTVRTSRKLDGPVEVMIRPHRIKLAAATDPAQTDGMDNRLRGTVLRTTFAGDVLEYEVGVNGLVLCIEQPTRGEGQVHAEGAPVMLSWRATDTFVFPAP